MSDNVLQTLQQLIQDVIAPDVRELKVRLSSFEKQVDIQFAALRQEHTAQFNVLLAAIRESKAETELSFTRGLAALSERVAILEAQRQ